jgi:hypothetical protein
MVHRPGRLAFPALVALVVLARAPLLSAAPFIRGDLNGDATIDLSDPIATLLHLFQGGTAPSCRDAGDSNDDGKIDIADALYTLNFLFTGGPAPGFPFPYCEQDPSQDALDCAEYTCPPARNEIVAIRAAEDGVEIELSTTRPFPARALYPILCIGGVLSSSLSRHPNGEATAIIFTLTREEFDAAMDGALVTVQHGACSEDLSEARLYWDLWIFEPLDKSILEG